MPRFLGHLARIEDFGWCELAKNSATASFSEVASSGRRRLLDQTWGFSASKQGGGLPCETVCHLRFTVSACSF